MCKSVRVIFSVFLLVVGISPALAAHQDVVAEILEKVPAAYVQPLDRETLAIWFLKGLGAVDKDLKVGNDNNKVTLYYRGRMLKSRYKPEDKNDADKWAEISADLLDLAVEKSSLAAKHDFELPDLMMQAAMVHFDAASKFYLNPEDHYQRRSKHRRNFAQRIYGDMLYLKILAFNAYTKKDIKKAIVGHQDKKGLILDLRGSPGGMLDQAVEIADLFLDEGIVLSTKGRRDGETVYYNSKDGDIWEGKPVVVLVDGGTASSAEVLTAALQEQSRAKVIGTGTFGKGSVQKLITLSSGATAAISNAYFYTPAGNLQEGRGVAPDICTAGMPPSKNIDNLLKQAGKLNCRKESRENEGLDIDVAREILARQQNLAN